MKGKSYIIKFLLVALAQVLIWNFCNFSQFLVIAVLPVLVMSLPVKMSSPMAMLVAFVTGFAVDFLGGATLGLSCLALVPVAALRVLVFRIVFGGEMFERDEEPTMARHGWVKMLLSLTLLTFVFLVVYIITDSAGTRPLWIDAVKLACSLAVGVALQMAVVPALCMEPAPAKWK